MLHLIYKQNFKMLKACMLERLLYIFGLHDNNMSFSCDRAPTWMIGEGGICGLRRPGIGKSWSTTAAITVIEKRKIKNVQGFVSRCERHMLNFFMGGGVALEGRQYNLLFNLCKAKHTNQEQITRATANQNSYLDPFQQIYNQNLP